MDNSNRKARFALSAGQQQLTASPTVAGQRGLVFSISSGRAPFAWLGVQRLGRPCLPFASVSSNVWSPPNSADALMKQLLSEEPDEPQGPRRGHTDEYYQQRCIFCASCKSTINSHYQKLGSKCRGCRRWFHATCMPAAAVGSAAATAEQQGAAEPAGADDAAAAAADELSSTSRQGRHRRNLFFHDEDCEQVYDRLAAVAAVGQQPFTLPDQRPFWQQLLNKQDPNQDLTWRLLDLTEVKALYKDAQKRDTLFRQHKKVRRQLQAAAEAAAEREAAAKRNRGFLGFGGSSSGSSGSKADNGGSSSGGADDTAMGVVGGRRGGRQSSLEEFLTVSEVLKPLGETPRDLLEDSYAIITRENSNGPTAVATFNVYGSDHARLQGLATLPHLQRKGHATRLIKQLELLLGDVGVQDLVVILEPQADKAPKPSSALLAPEAAQRWFKQRLGFRPASSEAQMLWRRELPEYHKGLIGGCCLLVKPLPKAKAVVKKAGRRQ